ncbi:MAG TPA: tetratricopeptide repeat protein [Caulobacterales bacterium]|jgi:TPR repeat protein|nr:tetratricopeptide repeat protein [Caulobacterales bacterium]
MRSLILLFFALLFAGQAARAENADIPVYQKLCDGGDAFYCQALGNIYNEGRDTPVNKAKAASAFVKACSGQASVACRYAGDLYAAGDGVTKDAAKAGTLYKRGCDLHDANSCTKSAQIGARAQTAPSAQPAAKPQSSEVLPDDPDAVLALARQGNPAAQNAVGWWYFLGDEGFPENRNEGLGWMTKASNQNYAPATVNMCQAHDRILNLSWGMMTAKGAIRDPIPALTASKADIVAALTWCKKATAADPNEGEHVAELYVRGWAGQAPDYGLAYAWALRYPHANTAIKTALRAKLTPAQQQKIEQTYKTMTR